MSEDQSHVVILDDDYIMLRSYIEELECLGINVSVAGNIAEFKDILSKSKQIDLIVLDVMLPSDGGDFSKLATDNDLRTGLLVAKALREKGIETPIIFFSVAWVPQMINEIKDTEKRVRNSIYLQKQSILPYKFAIFVQSVLQKGKVPEKVSKRYGKLVESLILKPAFFGFGIDIKNLFK